MDKLKKLFSLASDEPQAFKGTGHRLGRGQDQEQAASHPAERQRHSSQLVGTNSHRKSSTTPSQYTACPSQPSAREAESNLPVTPKASTISDEGSPGQQQLRLPNAHRLTKTDMFVSSTPTAAELRQVKANNPHFVRALRKAEGLCDRSCSDTADPANYLPAGQTTISDPTPKESRLGLSSARSAHPEEIASVQRMQESLAMVLSHPNFRASLSTLARILSNILSNPFDLRFRKMRLTNPKIHDDVVDVHGAVEFLEVCGFEFVFQEGAPSASGEHASGEPALAGYALLPEIAVLGPVEEAWQELCRVMQSHGIPLASQAAQPAAPLPAATDAADSACGGEAPAQPRPRQTIPANGLLASDAPQAAASLPLQQSAVARNTEVILPVACDVDVPEWVFQRTGADLKAEFQRLVKTREQSEQLMTRAMRERAKALELPNGGKVTRAVVRVRFPEGVCLQGCFGVEEPLTAVFNWVSEALRSPVITYELVDPARKPLDHQGRVGPAGLGPSCLLNFRPTGESAREFVGQPFLSDAMLKSMQAAY